MDVGYKREGLVMMELDPIGSGYPRAQLLAMCRAMIARLRNIPGVESASVSENGVFSGTESFTGLQVEGFRSTRDEDLDSAYDVVGPHYFKTVGIALLQGRDFDERDQGDSAKIAVVNETMAKFYFPNTNPIGRNF